jgi:hypothetical protein
MEARHLINLKSACAPTSAADAAVPTNVLTFSGKVVGAYVRVKPETAKVAGNHFACAYLTATPPSTLPRAKASAPYVIG